MYLYGAGGHAKVIIDILELKNIKIEGIFDDNPDISLLSGYNVIPYNGQPVSPGEVIISIGANKIRKKITRQYQFEYNSVVHPHSVISGNVEIGKGTVVMGNAVINLDSVIKDHVIVNTSASIDHDCTLDNFVHVAPGTVLCGNVKVKEGTFVGAGAVILPGITIGRWCTIGAGAIIIRDVPDFSVVVGNPGRIINKMTNE